MPFTLVAVLLLLLATASTLYVAKLDSEHRRQELARLETARLHAFASEAAAGLELRLLVVAAEALRATALPILDEAALNATFQERTLEMLQAQYPMRVGSFEASVENLTAFLLAPPRRTYETTPSNESATDSPQAPSKTSPGETPDALRETGANPSIALIAQGMLRISGPQGRAVLWPVTIERDLQTLLPLLKARLAALSADASGEVGGVARMVRYMLTSLAQLRVLQGYGAVQYGNGQPTSAILTPREVELAVNLALQLALLQRFRTVDREALVALEAQFGLSPGFLQPLLGPGLVDPADLFLLAVGLGGTELNLTLIVAQTIYALVDQFALKVLESLGFFTLLDLLGDVLSGLGTLWTLVTGALSDSDKFHRTVTKWVARTFSEAGLSELAYRSLFFAGPEALLRIPPWTITLEGPGGSTLSYQVGNTSLSIDWRTTDLLASPLWRAFYPTYMDAIDELRGATEDLVKRFSYVAAHGLVAPSARLELDPSDRLPPLRSLISALNASLEEAEFSLIQALNAPDVRFFTAGVKLLQSLAEFLMVNRAVLFDRDTVLQQARLELAQNLTAPVVALSSGVDRTWLSEALLSAVQQAFDDPAWGVGANLAGELDEEIYVRASAFWRALNITLWYDEGSWVGRLADLGGAVFLELLGSIGSLKEEALRALSVLAEGIATGDALANLPHQLRLLPETPFEFWDGPREVAELRGGMLRASPHLQQEPLYLADGNAADLIVLLRYPWEFDPSSTTYPNTHFTELFSISTRPFQTMWEVSVRGEVRLSASDPLSAASPFDLPDSQEHKVVLNFTVPIVVYSGWGLEGVHYDPSPNILLQILEAVRDFLEKLWDGLVGIVDWIGDAFGALARLVESFIGRLLSFATDLVEGLTKLAQRFVEGLQRFISAVVNSAIGKLIESVVSKFGHVVFELTLFGMTIRVDFNLGAILWKAKTLLALTVTTRPFGAEVAFKAKVLKFGPGDYDIVLSGGLRRGKVALELQLDPLMRTQRALVELHGAVGTWGFDIYLPYPQTYRSAQVSLQDLPGLGSLLSNIPIPALGVKGSFNAGLELRYHPPVPTSVVINEVELNPPGKDSGAEWIELYNPLDRPLDLTGYLVATLSGVRITDDLSGTIGPKGFFIHRFDRQALDNGESLNRFRAGDVLVLSDPSGLQVDVTAQLMDTENDLRTWQRDWDGGPHWRFRPHTPFYSNGPAPVGLSAGDYLLRQLLGAFQSAITKHLPNASLSLEFAALLVRQVLANFIEQVLADVKAILEELVLFLELRLSDLSGTVSGGLRVAFVLTGEAIVDLLRWLLLTVASVIANLLPTVPSVALPSLPRGALEHLYFRVQVFVDLGPPRFLEALGATLLPARLTAVASVAVNLPALGTLLGHRWGAWRIIGGVLIERLPGAALTGLLPVSPEETVDLWIVRAEVGALPAR